MSRWPSVSQSTQVAGELGREFAGGEDLHGEDFEAGAVKLVEGAAQIAAREEIAEHHGHAAPAMLAEKQLDALLDRRLAAGREVFQKGEQLRQRHPPRAGSQPLRHAAERTRAHFLLRPQPEHAERRGKLAREVELALKEHRIRRIHEHRDVHLLLLVELLHIRPLDAREDVPIHEPHVVARRVIAEIAELRARPALSREMLAARAVGEAPRRVQPQPREPVEVAVGEEGGELRGVHLSNAAVNILAITERDQLKAVRFDIEDVNHPIISNPKFESRYALQAFVMKKPKLCSE